MNTKSGLAAVHPAFSFFYFVGLFSFTFLFFHPLFLVTALVTVILLNITYNKGSELKKSFGFYLLIGIFIGVGNPIFSHRGAHILFYLFDQPVTLESIIYGLTMMFSIWVVFIGFLAFNEIITEDKFMYLFSAAAPKAALLTIMSIRLVPLLKRRLHEIASVQRVKGVSVQSGSIKVRAENGMKLLHILLTWSLEEALQTADSMKARGYGLYKRTAYFSYRMDQRDWIFFVYSLSLKVVCIILWFNGYGNLQIYPSLESLQLSGMELLTYLLFSMFLFGPLLIEGREIVKWHYLR